MVGHARARRAEEHWPRLRLGEQPAVRAVVSRQRNAGYDSVSSPRRQSRRLDGFGSTASLAHGAHVVIRDEEWLIRSAQPARAASHARRRGYH